MTVVAIILIKLVKKQPKSIKSYKINHKMLFA